MIKSKQVLETVKKAILLIAILMSNFYTYAQVISYSTDVNGIRLYPENDQLYPRDANDQATVTISGIINNPIYSQADKICLTVTKKDANGSVISSSNTCNTVTSNAFTFNSTISAGLFTYEFLIDIKDNSQIIIHSETKAVDVVCGDVYIVAGQSNALAGAWQSERATQDTNYKSKFSKTFGVTNASTTYVSTDIFWAQSYCNHSWSVEPAIGVWALKMQYLIQQNHQIPTCIINAVEGGTYIEKHQLDYSSTNDPLDLSTQFGALNYKVQQANYQDEVKGIIWYQGETTSGTGITVQNHIDELDELVTDWQSELGTIDKIYTVQIHTDCGGQGNNRRVREALRVFYKEPGMSNVVPIAANGIGDRKRDSAGADLIEQYNGQTVYCHFDIDAYNVFADRIYDLISRDFYCSNKMSGINSPNIQNAYFESGQVVLEFDQNLAAFPTNLENFFNFVDINGNEQYNFSGGATVDNKVYLDYTGSTTNYITYLKEGDPTLYPTSSSTAQREMFWLKNPEGNAAFSFHVFPIGTNECSNNNYDQELCGTLSTSIIKDKYITNCNVDCGSGYTNVNSGIDVELRAQNIIHLKPGFRAYQGSDVHVYISSPDNCTTSPASRIAIFEGTKPELVHPEVSIYPNPSRGQFTVRVSKTDEPNFLVIYNLLGEVIYYTTTLEYNQINISDQPKGIYVVKLKTNNQIITKKININ